MAQISFTVPSSLAVTGATTLSATTSSLLRVTAAGLVQTTTLASNLSLDSGTGILSLAAALTSVNSITSTALSALTLGTGTSGVALSFASATNIATFSAGVVGTSVTLSSLTAGRVTFAGASGLLTDDADFTFATDTLTVTKATIGGISHIANAITSANSVASAALSTLTLGTGTFGVAVTFASATGVPTFAAGAIFAGALSGITTLGASGVVTLTNATEASAGAGALVVTGGVATGKAIYIGSTTASTSTTTGALICAGGAGIAGNVFIGGTLTVTSAGAETDLFVTKTGSDALTAYIYNAGLTFGLWDGTNSRGVWTYTPATNAFSIPSTTASTSTTTGALQVAGGAGVAGALWIGGRMTISYSDPYQLLTATVGTNYAYTEWLNTSGNLRIGIENSAGAGILPGAPAYSSFIATVTAQPMVFATTNAVRMTIAAAGTVTLGTASPLVVSSTTASTSTTTGALICAGGVGVAGAMFLGGNLKVGVAALPTILIDSIDATTNGGIIAFASDLSYKWLIKHAANTDGNLFTIGTATGVSTSTPVLSLNYSTALTTLAGDLTVSGGNVGVGGAASTDVGLSLVSSTSGATSQFGIYSSPLMSSAATVEGIANYAALRTAVASFTLASGYSIFVATPTLGVGSAITTQRGLYVANQGAAGITNAYGISISAQSGAASVNVGLLNAGTTLLTNATASTSVSTGGLVCSGGVGVAGALWALNLHVTSSTLTYGASTALDFTGASGLQTVTLTGNITFTTSNLADGRCKIVRIVGDGSSRTLTFPAGWTFIGSSAPTALAANKTAILSLTAFSTTDASVIATYAVQP